MYKLLTTSLLIVLGLQACGSSDNKTTEELGKTTFTAVHGIQPDKVIDYVNDFKLQQSRLRFEFDNQSSAMFFVDNDSEDKQIIVTYDKGLAFIGFDLDEEKPLKKLTLVEGDTSDLENFSATRQLNGIDIEVTELGDDIIYTGSVVDASTNNIYPIRIVFNESVISGGNSTLENDGKKAVLSGTLGTSTYIQMQELVNTSNIDTLVLNDIDGSVNDDINMHTGRLIRNAQLTTLMPENGQAYSGGVDLFAAGVTRVFTDGGKLGVHSWCCENGKDARQLSTEDAAHGAQLTYFREMLGNEKGPEFYFFTINAAPADGIHLMSQTEMAKYSLTTQ